MSDKPIRVAIIDDDALVRRLLGTILEASGFQMAGQADDGDQIQRLVATSRPDVLLMDIRMERVSGVEATRVVKGLPSPPGVIALTSFDSRGAILDAVAAGVDGFLTKDAGPEEIAGAVRKVAAGEGALSPRAARVVLEHVRAAAPQDDPVELALLTQREREVADGVALGLSNAQIAARMFLSESTVKTHLVSAMGKVGAQNRVQLAVAVVRQGFHL